MLSCVYLIFSAYILRLPVKYAEEVRKRLREPEPDLRGLQLFLNPQKGKFKGRTGNFVYNLGDDSANLPSTQLVGIFSPTIPGFNIFHIFPSRTSPQKSRHSALSTLGRVTMSKPVMCAPLSLCMKPRRRRLN